MRWIFFANLAAMAALGIGAWIYVRYFMALPLSVPRSPPLRAGPPLSPTCQSRSFDRGEFRGAFEQDDGMYPKWQIGDRWYWEIKRLAPQGLAFTDYDSLMSATYAALVLDARADVPWAESCADNLGLDPADDPASAKACWQSHLARAEWMLTAEGFAALEDYLQAKNQEKPHPPIA